ncbi:MAG: hypothetical protein M3285_01705 [Actinomycetota bacterium]|nr:hypothetical protein [Actinomycetota bacterium]
MSDRDIRSAALAGLTSFALIILATFVAPPLWDAPTTTATANEVAEFGFPHRGRILMSFFIYSIAMGFFLWFGAGLWAWFRRWEAEPSPMPAVFAIGVVVAATHILAAFAPGALSVYRPPAAATAGLLFDLTFAILALSGIPTAVFLAAYATLVLRGAPLPKWTAWLAIVGVVAHVVIAGSFFPRSGFFSLEGGVIVWVPATLFAWILAASVALLRAPSPRT